ncbi:MAG TPA: extracellular solute-binding protein [Aestuariivirga sp.]|nr:ABC transporter substrate-binding protein [Alphaproteobacteria bacterium]HRX36915.1 extracellular solute-binding protein [Aestuariivirga sp.]
MTPIRTVAFLAALTLSAGSVWASPKHGIAMHGEAALPADFQHLPYVNPDAPQGGQLRQAIVGSFDSTNPFIVKGADVYGVRTYAIESLMGRSWAEPFSLYGLLAESIDVSDDRQTFSFKIRPEAKFSDGTPVTATDVVFSMETLRDKGRPGFKNSYGKVTKVETPDDHTVVFHQVSGDRELPLIIGVMPILSKASWDGKAFDQSSLDPIIGSGPYVMAEVKPGEAIIYKKNPDYWGKDLPINKGLWNFDEVRFDYYRDANAAFEAFKSGLVDVRIEADPTQWNSGYDFPAVTDGKITMEKIAANWPAPTTGFVFNTRRKMFEDVRVREALAMAFDFEWANANLFNGSYRRTYGYYSGSDLSSEGRPADARELAVLGDAAKTLRPEFLDGSYKLPVSDGSGRDRKMLRKAVGLLAEAGWKIGDNGLVNDAGEQFAFTIAVRFKDEEKLALHFQRTLRAIGIKTDVRLVDAAQFTRMRTTYDFDMLPWTWYNSASPGNEQYLYFGSSGRTAEGSRNYPGIADPAVDGAIKAMLDATSMEDFVAAVHAEDRLLVSGFYMVPLYNLGGQWVARWNYIGRPVTQPLPGFETTTLWRNP